MSTAQIRSVPPGWSAGLPSTLRRVFHPAAYQGVGRVDDYFEGWYVKLVDAQGRHPLALIPGVSRDRAGGTSHAFVQIVRPGGSTRYLRFPEDSFDFVPGEFAIRVGGLALDASVLHVSIDCDDATLDGAVRFGDLTPWPVTLGAPGIMGWYRYVPRMECYHGVVSFDHTLEGGLSLDGEVLDFSGGRGYIEKDWGSSFPSSWVWMQSNHFEGRIGTSLTASVARIPWLGSAFIGFIAGLCHEGTLYRLTTYTGARMTCFSSWGGGARFTLEDREHRLTVEVDCAAPAALKAPRHGRMVERADEALGSRLWCRLEDVRSGQTVFEGSGEHAGVEVMDREGELGAGTPPCPEAVSLRG